MCSCTVNKRQHSLVSDHPRTDSIRNMGDIVFSTSVCVFLCRHNNSATVRNISVKFYGHNVMIKIWDEFERMNSLSLSLSLSLS